jgi:hypothetical protein
MHSLSRDKGYQDSKRRFPVAARRVGQEQSHKSPRFPSLGLSCICVLGCFRKLLIKFAIADRRNQPDH